MIARQCINAILDAANRRPPCDGFKALFGVDSMLEKIEAAKELLNLEDAHWKILLDVTRVWPEMSSTTYQFIAPDKIEKLFWAIIELYLQTGEKLGLKGEIER